MADDSKRRPAAPVRLVRRSARRREHLYEQLARTVQRVDPGRLKSYLQRGGDSA